MASEANHPMIEHWYFKFSVEGVQDVYLTEDSWLKFALF